MSEICFKRHQWKKKKEKRDGESERGKMPITVESGRGEYGGLPAATARL